jgi:hypothetical protein
MKRPLAIIAFAGAVLLSTHILAPAQSPTPPAPVKPADLQPIDQVRPLVDTVDAAVGRLRERLSSAPEYPNPVRDPFRFGAHAEPAPRPVVTPVKVLPPVIVAAAPAVTLPHIVAILSQTTEAGAERVASLAMGDEVGVVKAGESFLQFVVRRIDADMVELVDPVTGSTFKISLN